MFVLLAFLATFFCLLFLFFYLSVCFCADSLADLDDMSGLSFERASCFSKSLGFSKSIGWSALLRVFVAQLYETSM